MINVNSNHKISHFCTTQLWEAQKYFVSNDINIILLKKYMKLFKKKIIIYRENSFWLIDQTKFFPPEYLDSIGRHWKFILIEVL